MYGRRRQWLVESLSERVSEHTRCRAQDTAAQELTAVQAAGYEMS